MVDKNTVSQSLCCVNVHNTVSVQIFGHIVTDAFETLLWKLSCQ